MFDRFRPGLLLGLILAFALGCSLNASPAAFGDVTTTTTTDMMSSAPDLPLDLAVVPLHEGLSAKNCMSCHHSDSGSCPEDLKTPAVAVVAFLDDVGVGDRNLCRRYPDLCCPGCAVGAPLGNKVRDPASRVDKQSI